MRITTGLWIDRLTDRSSHSLCSITSAFSFSNSTTARRTVQTLIGSKVALRTSTRPPSRPRRWCSSGDADPTGVGVVVPMAGASVARAYPVSGNDSCALGRWKRAQYAHHLDVLAQPGESLGDMLLGVAPLEIQEEHVVPEPLLARPRFYPREVHPAGGEL